jgi:superfamily II DNA or RNA helicase
MSPKDDGGNISPSLRLKKLLIERSRVAKKAHEKVEAASRIANEHYRSGQHWLVYCEDQKQVSDVVDALQQKELDPMVYHSSMDGDQKRTLDYYIKNGGIMVAIRCLDEGVDIPCISHAVILASSQNPRQFIQRRGRVLRTAWFKSMATIWDTLVMPLDDDSDDEQIQDSLTRAEFLRALEFAEHAMNQHEASELRQRSVEMGLELSKVYPAQEDIQEDESA